MLGNPQKAAFHFPTASTTEYKETAFPSGLLGHSIDDGEIGQDHGWQNPAGRSTIKVRVSDRGANHADSIRASSQPLHTQAECTTANLPSSDHQMCSWQNGASEVTGSGSRIVVVKSGRRCRSVTVLAVRGRALIAGWTSLSGFCPEVGCCARSRLHRSSRTK